MDIMFTSLLGSAVVLALIFFREFFLWLRNNIPKSVQCWFCHAKTKVEYRFANNWYCSNCNQYNGFTKDGGYNRIIDNHYEEKLNFTITSVGRTKDAWKSTNRLCEKCNRNQELKVQQLASFVPLNEKNYDIEIEHYRVQLEKSYKLCSNCEGLLTKIFSNERNLFSLPRRLASGFIIKPEVTGIGRPILYLNLLVSLIISLSAYVNLEGIPPFLAAYLQKFHHFHVPLWIFKSKYLLPSGLVLNILAWINTFSIGLLLNTVSWIIVYTLTVYPSRYKHYIIALQALSGIISCGVSIICLTSNQRKIGDKSKSSPFEGKKFNISQNYYANHLNTETATSYTAPYEENLVSQAYQKGNNRNIPNNTKSAPPPSPPKTPLTTTNIIKPQRNWPDSINTGIRGLSLGNNAASINGFKNCSRRDDAWWVNSGNSKQKRGSQRNTTQYGFNSNRPPSTPSSGFSDVDDIVDDNGSCTGHSPLCKHYSCQLTPPQYTCYYAAAHFQRLLYSTPPSPPVQVSTLPNIQTSPSLTNPLSYIYTLPVFVLIISNITLLWTIYNKETVKE
uniref:Putative conserved plasma membrane protein n=1 Tax=Panstrongylus lignarius TaxID=156445 RepID=A0A224XHI5_9HEMI